MLWLSALDVECLMIAVSFCVVAMALAASLAVNAAMIALAMLGLHTDCETVSYGC